MLKPVLVKFVLVPFSAIFL